ncbi:MAG: hypothetical protein LBT21_05595 [Oscillospiraceae bacterium]|jgi:hypothetical protein|nr:hypothetical protein [Oscillospiraceae bacterium]
MKKRKKGLLWKIPLCTLCALLAAILVLGAAIAIQGKTGWHEWEDWQQEHLAQLRAASLTLEPQSREAALAAEKARTGVDVGAEIKSGTKFNQLRGLITHNSYKQKMPAAGSFVFNSLYLFGSGMKGEYEYTFEPLTDQLNNGVMGLELDLYYTMENGAPRFLFCHAPLIDMNSSAIDAGLALEELALWSKAHPSHLPIVLLIEPKEVSLSPFNIYGMDKQYFAEFDKLIRDSLGDSLLSPADMLGDYTDFAALRADDGWLPLEQTLGKFVPLFHPNETLTPEYIAIDSTLRTQAMFPAFQWQDWANPLASFVLANDPKEAYDNSSLLVDEQNLIVRSRVDVWPEYTAEEYKLCMESGAQWFSTDYPKRTDAVGTPSYFEFAAPSADLPEVVKTPGDYHISLFPSGGTAMIKESNAAD